MQVQSITRPPISKLSSATARRQVLLGSLATIVMKGMYSALTIGVSISLARVLGPSEFGSYSLAIAIGLVASVPVQLGLPLLVVRETARYSSAHEWSLLRGIWRWANGVTGTATILFLFPALLGLLVLLARGQAELGIALVLSICMVPIAAIAGNIAAAVRGLGYVVLGQLPEKILRPAMLLGSLLLASYALGGGRVDADRAMALNMAAASVSLALALYTLSRVAPREVKCVHPSIDVGRSEWRRALIPLSIYSGLVLALDYIDILVLGGFMSRDQVGVYRVASQGSLLVVFGLQAADMYLAPRFAKLSVGGSHQDAASLMRASIVIALVFAVPIVLLFLLFGEWFLNVVFGADYRGAKNSLVILSIGKLFSAGVGSVVMYMNMTGRQVLVAASLAVAVAINLALCMVLVPRFGLEGAAAGTAVSIGGWSLLVYMVFSRAVRVHNG